MPKNMGEVLNSKTYPRMVSATCPGLEDFGFANFYVAYTHKQ